MRGFQPAGVRAQAQKYANGGLVRGPGTGTSDDVADNVPEGTYIMPADTTQAVGADQLAAMGTKDAAQDAPAGHGGQDGQGKQIPVQLSNGEYKLPPEQVHAIGVQALDQMKNATHQPVGFVPGAAQEAPEPRMFFANGGVVRGFTPRRNFADGGMVDEPKRPNSFGDAATAAANPGARQVATASAQAPAALAPEHTLTAAPEPATSAPAAGAGRGLVNPSMAEPSPSEPSQTAPASQGHQLTGTQSSSTPGARGFSPAGISKAAAGAVSSTPGQDAGDAFVTRSNAEATGRLMATGQIAAPQAGFSGVIGTPINNGFMGSRTPEQQRRDAEVSASSIMNDGGRWDQHKGLSPARMALQALDAQALEGIKGDNAITQAAMRESGAVQRTGMEQAGETQRSRFQQALADIRERRQAQHQINQEDIARQRLQLESQRANLAGVPSGYRRKADGTDLEYVPGGPADPNTPKGKNNLTDVQAKALQFGTRMQQSGQILDGLAATGTSQPGYIKRAADAVGAGALANWTQSPEQQQVEQAQRDFVNATLRRESGAAISNSEFASARQQYFPQPGDNPKVIEQKRQNRELATRGILAEVPNHAERVRQVLGTAGQGATQPLTVSRTGTLNGRRVVQYSDGSISYAD